MTTPQTQKEVKQTLRDTMWWVRYYKKRAVKCWRWHRVIRIVLFLEVISEFGLLMAYGHNRDSCGDLCSDWVYRFEIIILVMLGVTLLWDFLSDYTRKAEVFDSANMECRLVGHC